MANYTNHLIDPSYFYDCIEEFAFDYDLYQKSEQSVDDYGRIISTFTKQTIRGSLQTEGLRLSIKENGNTQSNDYKFYCKSLYRINIGDFIFYKNSWLHVNEVHEYDEWGVRECSLSMVQLSAYRDLEEYLDYINGETIV